MKAYTLSVADVARQLGLSIDAVYELVEKRQITHLRTQGRVATRVVQGKRQPFRVSGRIRFAPEDVQAWIDAHVVAAQAAPASEKPYMEIEPLPMPATRRFAR